ncbi:hypothetical protein Tco_0900115 [Tanacetum coccineum]
MKEYGKEDELERSALLRTYSYFYIGGKGWEDSRPKPSILTVGPTFIRTVNAKVGVKQSTELHGRLVVKTLTAEVETKAAILEGCKAIFAKDGTPLYTPFYYSPEEIEYFSSNSDFLDDEKSKSTEVKTSKVIPELTSNLPEQAVTYYVEPNLPTIPFPNRLKQHAEEALVHKTMKSLKKLRKECKKYRHLVTPLEKNVTGAAYAIMKLNVIGKVKMMAIEWRFENEYDDSDEFEDPNGCGECREYEIFKTIINKLHDEWFKGTDEYDEDLEGIIDYLEPTLYDEFIDSDDEEYKERKCRLLGMPYIKPP